MIHLEGKRRATRGAFLQTAFAAAVSPQIAESAALTPVRVGLAAADTTAEGFYGLDNGMFRSAGLDVQLTPMRATGALAAALAGGSLDIVAGTLAPFLEGRSHGIDFRVIAPGAIYDSGPSTSPIAVASGSKIRTAAELNGKVIALSGIGDLTNLMANAWLDANGADRSTIKFIEIPFPESASALNSGRVDAAVMVEPFISAAQGQVTIIADPLAAIAKRFLITGWFSTSSWINANRDTTQRFIASMLKVGAWSNSHRTETGAMLAKIAPIQPDVLRKMTRAVYGTAPITPDLLEPVIDKTAKYFHTAKIPAGHLIWS